MRSRKEYTAEDRSRKNNGLLRKFITLCTAAAVISALLMTVSCTSGMNDNSSGSADDKLDIYFLDVGQADSTILISQGEAVLVDAGNRDDSDFITGYLGKLGIDRLKYVIFTHPHEYHIGSGEAVVDNFEIDKIYMLDEYDNGIEGQLRRTISDAGIDTEAPEPGDTVQFGECMIEFLGPYRNYDSTNDDSICLKVTHGKNRILFTGDAGRITEKDMIEAGENLEADLLQAGHHGSSTSNSYYLLRESNPEYVVISCGEGNMYGHPHEEALSRFSDLGAEVFRTDTQGTIIAESDGRELTFNCEGSKASGTHTDDYEEASYIGNLNSKKFHDPDCSGLPDEDNRVYFRTRAAAVDAGYEPCGRCRP